MIKKISNSENIFLANAIKHPLKEHSIAVALYGHLLLKSLKFKLPFEKEINNYLIYSALLHDIGKISTNFQKYIKSQEAKNNNWTNLPMDTEASRPKRFEGPYHNEISWAYIVNFIDFKNKTNNNIICHSVYWHHPANCSDNENELRFGNSEIIFEKIEEDTTTLLNDMHAFIKDLFSSFSNYYKDSFNGQDYLKKPNKNNIDEEKYCPSFFSHKENKSAYNATKQLCLNLLIESDRTVSSWSSDCLNKFLKNWKTQIICQNKTNGFSILEDWNNSLQSKEQYNLAQKMADKKLSICGIDPAGGKTSISLYWWYKCSNKYPLMIALPRQHQITGLFKSLEKDVKRIYSDQKIKIEGVFNGERKHENWDTKNEDDILVSDINILVFDRFLSPYYKRSQSSEFLRMLQSHLVLDEFHEFKNLSKMIPSLKEILTIRSWLESGVKTLMLSGTPEPSLLNLLLRGEEKRSTFKRTELSPRKGHEFKLFMNQELNKTKQFIPDCLYSFLRVESCQEVFSQFFKSVGDKIKMIHTHFTVSDKKELLEEILKEHSKEQGSIISNKSVITSKMLQSSYNLSFKKAVLELSQPYMDCQTAGRINRFGNKSESEMYFFYNDETENFFDENRAGFKKNHKKWKEHILSFIEKKKGKTVSIRELMNSYDEFWNEDNIEKSLEVLKNQQKKAVKELNKYTPKRFFSRKNKKTSSINSLFRGDSYLLSACVVNDEGQPIDQLKDEDFLSEGRDWLIQKINSAMQNCLNSKLKCKKANEINKKEIFEYKKHANRFFGFKTERPLLCSHINEEIDQCLSKKLRNEDNNSTNHRVYHKKFGLVKKDSLN